MKNKHESLVERNKEIYSEFMTGNYTLAQLGEKFNLHLTMIGRIIEKFLKKK